MRHSTSDEPDRDAYGKRRDGADHVNLDRFLKSTVAQTILYFLLSTSKQLAQLLERGQCRNLMRRRGRECFNIQRVTHSPPITGVTNRYTKRDASSAATPSEFDSVFGLAIRHGKIDLAVAHEQDFSLDLTGLVQRYVAIQLRYELNGRNHHAPPAPRALFVANHRDLFAAETAVLRYPLGDEDSLHFHQNQAL